MRVSMEPLGNNGEVRIRVEDAAGRRREYTGVVSDMDFRSVIRDDDFLVDGYREYTDVIRGRMGGGGLRLRLEADIRPSADVRDVGMRGLRADLFMRDEMERPLTQSEGARARRLAPAPGCGCGCGGNGLPFQSSQPAPAPRASAELDPDERPVYSNHDPLTTIETENGDYSSYTDGSLVEGDGAHMRGTGRLDP